MSQPRIFVSYSRRDTYFTQRLVSDLNAAGADVWVDQAGIQHGNFMERIDEALAQCEWMVLVLTPNSIDSPYVRQETYTALHRVQQGYMRAVIPILAAPCLPGIIPPQWDALHRYDATRDYAAALAGVVEAVGLSAMTGPAVPSTVPTPPTAGSESTLPSAGNAEELHLRGEALMMEGQFAEAITLLERAADLEPDNAANWSGLATALYLLGRNEEALQALDRAVAIAPFDATAWYMTSCVLNSLGLTAEARAAERRWKELSG
jgi:tetratricopeptide (TPR) repeat protein